jgi:nucleoid-associated protein YgaU
MRKTLTAVAAVGSLAAAALGTAASAQAATQSQWDALAMCESGGRWNLNVGAFDGGLQFSPATWNAYGGRQFAPTADQATKEQQITIAAKVAAGPGGWNNWPVCSRKAGLVGASPSAPDFGVHTDSTASRSANRAPLGSPTDPNKGGSTGHGKHVVHSGETLSSIARANHVNGGWQALFAANKTILKDANHISVGQVLSLP